MSDMGYVRVIVRVEDCFWSRFYILDDCVTFHKNRNQLDSSLSFSENCQFRDRNHPKKTNINTKKSIVLGKSMNGYQLSYFWFLLRTFQSYRERVHSNLCSYIGNGPIKCVQLTVNLFEPESHVIDKMWNHRICYLVSERCELDNAFSWLSTLGGAYSALGDEFSYCAEMAGKISIKQFQLAFRLGDESILSRCKLYVALSLIQTKKFRRAKLIIQEQYRLASDSAHPDVRLERMCRGIWSKLRYEHSKHKEQYKLKHCKTS